MNLVFEVAQREARKKFLIENKYMGAYDEDWWKQYPVYYLAGPMRNIPQFNFPAFNDAAKDLRSRNIVVINPAELDDPELREKCLNNRTGHICEYDFDAVTMRFNLLARDILIVADHRCLGIVALPGWTRSDGARLETRNAFGLNKPVFTYPDLIEIERSQHPEQLIESLVEQEELYA